MKSTYSLSYLACCCSSVSGSLAASSDSGDLGGSSSSLEAIYFKVQVSFLLASLSFYCLVWMSRHIPNMELKSLRIGEGGLPWHEVEHEGARGEDEAPASAPLLGASASGAAAAPPSPAGGTPISIKSSTIFRTLCFLSYSNVCHVTFSIINMM